MSIVFDKIRLIGVETINLPIANAAITDSYILKTVDGLGPPDTDVFLAATVKQGGSYLGRRPVNRQIVIRIGLNPDYSTGQTPADLRTALYGLLTPPITSDYLQVQLISGSDIAASTYGYISKFETVPFSKDPEVQITIDCPDTFLNGEVETVTGLSGATPIVDNTGTAPTGFYMEIAMTADMSDWTMVDAAGGVFWLHFDFLNGDTMFFDTDAGSRGVYLVRDGGDPVSLLAHLNDTPVWHQLRGGTNSYYTTCDGFNTPSNFTMTTFRFTQKFWGI